MSDRLSWLILEVGTSSVFTGNTDSRPVVSKVGCTTLSFGRWEENTKTSISIYLYHPLTLHFHLNVCNINAGRHLILAHVCTWGCALMGAAPPEVLSTLLKMRYFNDGEISWLEDRC